MYIVTRQRAMTKKLIFEEMHLIVDNVPEEC